MSWIAGWVGKKTGQDQLSSVLISLYDFKGNFKLTNVEMNNAKSGKIREITIRKQVIWNIKNSTATKRNLFVNNMISASLKNATGLF